MTVALSFTLPVLFSLRLFLPVARTVSFTVPATLASLLCFLIPLPARASRPGPGTLTIRTAVPFFL